MTSPPVKHILLLDCSPHPSSAFQQHAVTFIKFPALTHFPLHFEKLRRKEKKGKKKNNAIEHCCCTLAVKKGDYQDLGNH